MCWKPRCVYFVWPGQMFAKSRIDVYMRCWGFVTRSLIGFKFELNWPEDIFWFLSIVQTATHGCHPSYYLSHARYVFSRFPLNIEFTSLGFVNHMRNRRASHRRNLIHHWNVFGTKAEPTSLFFLGEIHNSILKRHTHKYISKFEFGFQVFCQFSWNFKRPYFSFMIFLFLRVLAPLPASSTCEHRQTPGGSMLAHLWRVESHYSYLQLGKNDEQGEN